MPRLPNADDLLLQINNSLGGGGPVDRTVLDAVIAALFTGSTVLTEALANDRYPRLDGANAGPLGGRRNLLDNASWQINQRQHALGALAAGEYGLDRWKAGASGADIGVAGTTLTLTSGSLQQVLEAPDLAGRTVTVSSASAPTGDVTVSLAGESGVVNGASPAVTLTLPGGATGNQTLEIAGSGVSLGPIQLEIGETATPLERVHPACALLACQRYYAADIHFAMSGYASAGGQNGPGWVSVTYPVPMRIGPAVTISTATEFNLNTGLADVRAVGLSSLILEAASVAAGRTAWEGTVTLDADL